MSLSPTQTKIDRYEEAQASLANLDEQLTFLRQYPYHAFDQDAVKRLYTQYKIEFLGCLSPLVSFMTMNCLAEVLENAAAQKAVIDGLNELLRCMRTSLGIELRLENPKLGILKQLKLVFVDTMQAVTEFTDALEKLELNVWTIDLFERLKLVYQKVKDVFDDAFEAKVASTLRQQNQGKQELSGIPKLVANNLKNKGRTANQKLLEIVEKKLASKKAENIRADRQMVQQQSPTECTEPCTAEPSSSEACSTIENSSNKNIPTNVKHELEAYAEVIAAVKRNNFGFFKGAYSWFMGEAQYQAYTKTLAALEKIAGVIRKQLKDPPSTVISKLNPRNISIKLNEPGYFTKGSKRYNQDNIGGTIELIKKRKSLEEALSEARQKQSFCARFFRADPTEITRIKEDLKATNNKLSKSCLV